MDLQVEHADWEKRLARLEQLERDAMRLQQEAITLRTEWQQLRQQQNETSAQFEALRDAVLRYAVACGATEVQAAMVRARGDNSDAAENLRRCVEEQNEASNALRALARTLQRFPDSMQGNRE